jgi:hypothetical protein
MFPTSDTHALSDSLAEKFCTADGGTPLRTKPNEFRDLPTQAADKVAWMGTRQGIKQLGYLQVEFVNGSRSS